MTIEDSAVFKVRDSVDLFLTDGTYLTAYYMNSRKRRTFRVSEETVGLLERIDGRRQAGELKQLMREELGADPESTDRTLESLHRSRILTEVGLASPLEGDDEERYARQTNYFAEFLGDEADGPLAQRRLAESRVSVFGCGAVGGDIAIELAMAGVRHFTLVDYDVVEPSNASRHLYFDLTDVGKPKVESLARRLREIDPRVSVEEVFSSVRPEDDIEPIVSGCDFVVNTMDEPYIGYTSAKVSRVCVKHNKAHYIAGGFDAHLASTGELVIPHVTPCVECYARYFKESLKDWKPSRHPIKERALKIGGLSPMSLFSASFASIEIVKYLTGIVGMNSSYKPRGEWLFNNMSLSYLDVPRDPECPICGEGVLL